MSARPAHGARWALALLTLCAGLGGCDWEHYALMNSVPAEGDPTRNPEVRVYLGVDGLTPSAVEKARQRGAFEEEGWRLSRFISMFPSTSDASWTRILRTAPFNGYEYGYYDPTRDELVNAGIGGLLAHVIPPFEGSPLQPPEHSRAPAYYGAFDHHATAYLDAVWSYDLPNLTLHQSLDALFTVLGGRSETRETFSGYVLQVDVIGHELGEEAMVSAVVALSDHIQRFRRAHPERRFFFTLFSDHGIDFVKKPPGYVIDFRDELLAAGVLPVQSFAQGRAQPLPFAVPVLHTRVTYLALHTPADQVEEVARRTSRRPSVDLLLTRAAPPADGPPGVDAWYALWADGGALLRFGYEPGRDLYWLPREAHWARLDVTLPPPLEPSPWVPYGDEALFLATRDRRYPDLFFRARTGLEPLSVRHTADLLVSFRAPYVSVGFEVPGGSEVGTAGSHGSFEGGSAGTLLTDERELPPAVRSDQLLGLFPRLEEHVRRRGVTLRPETEGAWLDLDAIP